ncbi:MAG: hypothetical protein JXX28_13790 [Deltaproteobacteria bacterium]|nr:hypothetical protein [Deltaproteobacteria bacterium]
MRLLLLAVLLGCPHTAPEGQPAPCALPDGLMDAVAGARPEGLRFDEAGRVEVVIEADPALVLPEGCTESLRAMGLIQALCPPEVLCPLQSRDDVVRVRAPRTPSPK